MIGLTRVILRYKKYNVKLSKVTQVLFHIFKVGPTYLNIM